MDIGQNTVTRRKKQAHPAEARGKSLTQQPQGESSSRERGPEKTQTILADEQVFTPFGKERLTPFSTLLRRLLRRNRAEITRIALELQVSENTIYRWMSGSSEPRQNHLKQLLDVLPDHRVHLTYAINQTFKGFLDTPSMHICEVSRDIYVRVVELVATTADDDTRLWQVAQAIFDCALLQLDIEKQGVAITYANLMPPHEDGVHSLREVMMRGSSPWPTQLEARAYLGSTSLAGVAAIMQRTQTWDLCERGDRLQVEIDEYEKSICAYPVMRAGKLAGVLIVSSGLARFFTEPIACQVVAEYANLLALALPEQAFLPFSSLCLRPMPSLVWQRAELRSTYLHRILATARKYTITRHEAEQRIIKEMEAEFEERSYQLRQEDREME